MLRIALDEIYLWRAATLGEEVIEGSAPYLDLPPGGIAVFRLDSGVIPGLLSPAIGGNDHRYRLVSIRERKIQHLDILEAEFHDVVCQEIKRLGYRFESIHSAALSNTSRQEPCVEAQVCSNVEHSIPRRDQVLGDESVRFHPVFGGVPHQVGVIDFLEAVKSAVRDSTGNDTAEHHFRVPLGLRTQQLLQQ